MQVGTAAGVEVQFPPLSVPPATNLTIGHILNTDLGCPLDTTRFDAFGYKDLSVSPALGGPMNPPARVYWRVPSRFKSLEKIKFITAPSKGMQQEDALHRLALLAL